MPFPFSSSTGNKSAGNRGGGGGPRFLLTGGRGSSRPPLLANRNAGVSNGGGGGSHRVVASRGGGQVLLQRPRLQAQQQTKQQTRTTSTLSRVTPLQQQRQQSQKQSQQQQHAAVEISMEEITRDLQILEAQQLESARKLKAAEAAKQRALEKHSRLESRLGELKYVNGQSRAQLERWREILAQSQKNVDSMHQQVDTADKDLRDFNRDLQAALQDKLHVLCLRRKQERQFGRIQKKLEELASRKDRGESEQKKLESRLDGVNRREKSLHDSFQKQKIEHQNIATELAAVNAGIADLERSVEERSKAEAAGKLKIKELKEKDELCQQQHKNAMAEIEDLINKAVAECGAVQEALAKEQTSLEDLQQQYESACQQFVDQCNENGIPTDRQENQPPAWDEDAAKAMLDAEDKALQEEKDASAVLERELEQLNTALTELEKEAEESAKDAAEKKEAVKKARATEEERAAQMDKVLAQLETDKAELKVLQGKVKEKEVAERAAQEKQNAEDRETAQKLAEEIAAIEEENRIVEQELAKMNKQIEENDKGRKEKLEAEQREKANLEAENRSLEAELARVKAEADALEEEDKADEHYDEELAQEYTQLVALHPQLGTLTYTYRPDLTTEDQAQIDLDPLIQECRKNEAAAKELRKKREQQKQEEKERQREEEAYHERKALEKLERGKVKEEQKRERARARKRLHRQELEREREKADRERRRREKRERRKHEVSREDRGKNEQRHEEDQEKRSRMKHDHSQDQSAKVKATAETSAAKPRNLLDNFAAQSPKESRSKPHAAKPEPTSSKKKVRWSEDGDLSRRQTSSEKNTEKTTSATQHKAHAQHSKALGNKATDSHRSRQQTEKRGMPSTRVSENARPQAEKVKETAKKAELKPRDNRADRKKGISTLNDSSRRTKGPKQASKGRPAASSNTSSHPVLQKRNERLNGHESHKDARDKPKVQPRRRKRTSVAQAKPAGLMAYGEDCSFNFGA